MTPKSPLLKISAGKGESIERKISISGSQKMEISLGEGARAKISLDFWEGEGEIDSAVFLGRGASLFLLEKKLPEFFGTVKSRFSLSAGSEYFGINAIASEGKLSEEREIVLKGKRANARQSEVFFVKGKKARFESSILVVHKEPQTTANSSSKGLLSEGGEAISRGLVKIEKKAQKTDSFLSQHAILLDSVSKNDTVPSLEIEANDVKASHSAASGPIDPDAIFYLSSRGLPRRDAEKMVALGFLGSELGGIGEAEKGELLAVFAKKLGGTKSGILD